MKKTSLLLIVLLIAVFAVFALGSGESSTVDQGSGEVETTTTAKQENGKAEADTSNTKLGKYDVVIDSCRLAEDYEGKPVVIVKYIFTNVSNDNASSFMISIDDGVFQNGVGLEEAYFLDDSANYDSANQLKDIKKGASLDVEVAYVLNDTTTDIEVEVSELISLNKKTVTKTFSIAD